MVNTALRTYQRQRFDFEQTGYERLPDVPIEPDAISSLSEQELLTLIAKLPDGYRMVFNLVAMEGFSHAEAAEMLNIQESTSRSQLTKARRWLIDQLANFEKASFRNSHSTTAAQTPASPVQTDFLRQHEPTI